MVVFDVPGSLGSVSKKRDGKNNAGRRCVAGGKNQNPGRERLNTRCKRASVTIRGLAVGRYALGVLSFVTNAFVDGRKRGEESTLHGGVCFSVIAVMYTCEIATGHPCWKHWGGG